MSEGRILLDIDTYSNLIRQAHSYQLLTEALYEDATLSWRKGMLNLDAESASTVLRALDPGGYACVLEDVERKKETEGTGKEGTHGDDK